MKFFIYCLPILGFATMLNASEGPASASRMVTLISSDGKEFKIPLEIFQKLNIADVLRNPDKRGLVPGSDNKELLKIPGSTLAEVAQLMWMAYRYKNLDENQLLEKAKAEISVADNYAFITAVIGLGFKLGIDLAASRSRHQPISLSKEDYEYYMKIIQELNPEIYTRFKECDSVTGGQSLRISMLSSGAVDNSMKPNCPFITISPLLKYNEKREIKSTLVSYFVEIESQELTENERADVLEVIKELAPDLYKLIIKNDPHGARHIVRFQGKDFINAAAGSEFIDGLPMIHVSSFLIKMPKDELRYVIAHELGHYALKHLAKKSAPSLSKLQEQIAAKAKERLTENTEKGEIIKKVPTVKGQLPFNETFEKAFSRTNELEADRFAVMELGASIDAGIAFVEEERSSSTPTIETFISTHPLAPARIKQFEDLRAEVALNKARGVKPKPIDWKGLAEFYTNKMNAPQSKK